MNKFLLLHTDTNDYRIIDVIVNLDNIIAIDGGKYSELYNIDDINDKDKEYVTESADEICDMLLKEGYDDMFIKLHRYPNNEIILFNKKYIERVYKGDFTGIVCKRFNCQVYENTESIYAMLK